MEYLQYLAITDTDPAVLALIAIVATVITALFKLLSDNTKALGNMVASSEKIAHATDKGAREAKQRNGHLGEQNIKLAELVSRQSIDVSAMKEISIKNLQANARVAEILSKSASIAAEDRDFLTSPNPQIVTKQTVEHQIVKETSNG